MYNLSSSPSVRQLPAESREGLDVNIDSLLCRLDSSFNPLHRDCLLKYHITAETSGQVCMSVAMPREMLNAFSLLLESMGGFFRVVDRKAKSAAAVAKVHDLGVIANRESLAELRLDQICAIFDNLTNQGHDQKEAAKLTNKTLKALNSPWASRDIIDRVLRDAGRFRKQKAGEVIDKS